MAINTSDAKLFESQRLTDEEDGGGRVTGNEVIDGNVNNLFQDISRMTDTGKAMVATSDSNRSG